MNMLDWAIAYHRFGLCVLPAVCKSKKAAVPYKEFEEKRPTMKQVREWFKQDYSIAALMGEPSDGIVARDFDSMLSYDRWATEYADLAKTLPTSIGDRGRTVWARADLSNIRSLSKTGATIITLTDGELRGGGLTILPPSLHPVGEPYRWHVPIDFDRPIPTVDVVDAGFLCDGVNTEHTENTEDTESTDGKCTLSNPKPSVFSGHSVFSVFEERLRTAVVRTIPPGHGKRQRKLFMLARELKAIPEIAALPVDQLEPVVREWHRIAVKYIRTQPFIESWLDFKQAWANVRYAAGTSAVDVAFQQAVSTAAPARVASWDSEPLVNLVKLCRSLQQSRGAGQSFFLDSRTAGRLLGVVHSQAWQWLRALVAEGILELVAAGSQRERKANEYRYKLGD